MKTNLQKIVAIALLFMTASAQALQPEVLYAFQLGPKNPSGSLVQGSDGNFYGTSPSGGSSDRGTVFKVTTNGVLTTLVSFAGANGASPRAGLILSSDGNLYGTTEQGGSSNLGTVFKMTTNGVLTSLVSFNGADGAYPDAALVLGNDGAFYGITTCGGSSYVNPNHPGDGTVFKVTTNGVFTSLVSFNDSNGAAPTGLVLGNDGAFYGTTSRDGEYDGSGTVFKVTTTGVLTMLTSFNGTNGWWPNGLVLGGDGDLYGTTIEGGSGRRGTVFSVTTNGVLTTLVSFDGQNGAYPVAELMLGSDGHFYGTTSQGGSSANHGTVFRVTRAGVLTTLVSFANADGASPYAGLVLGSDGHFYGATQRGGSSDYGTVFRVTTNGVLTSLVSFANADGASPYAGLVLGSDGYFYGTTDQGGPAGGGTVFKVTTNGLLTTLISFNGTNGWGPNELVLGVGDNLYGTTYGGGSSGHGTVFKMTPNGVLTTLGEFTGTNGSAPFAGLVLGGDGHFYGTTWSGGSSYVNPNQWSYGTVFKVTVQGVLTSLVSFNGTNGAAPMAGLVAGNDGNFYGTTTAGGIGLRGSTPGGTGSGTVFKVTTNGGLTTLVSFTGSNGDAPDDLVLGSDGSLYGTTRNGGSSSYNAGTVFKVTTNGVLTTLVSFIEPNGAYPNELLLDRDGCFYGTTSEGGNSIYGTVFKLATNGVLTSLVSFTGENGANPYAGLVAGPDGSFYGTTSSGGPGGGGTIFRLVISAFTSVARQPDRSVLLTGTGPANGGYRLWASADLSSPFASWALLTSASFDSNGNFSFTDAGALTNTSRFYQLSIP